MNCRQQLLKLEWVLLVVQLGKLFLVVIYNTYLVFPVDHPPFDQSKCYSYLSHSRALTILKHRIPSVMSKFKDNFFRPKYCCNNLGNEFESLRQLINVLRVF